MPELHGEPQHWHFVPFHLDLQAGQLWRGTEAVRLTAKAFGALCHLVTHAGQLVTRDALVAAVWDATYVSEASLAMCIRELRQALGDTAHTPRYVETVRRRGYRFIAPATSTPVLLSPGHSVPHAPAAVPRPHLVVGREAELHTLQQCWAQAQQGVRQVVMVTGEAGIGKSTLVDLFVEQLTTTDAPWLARGQCLEQHGAGEAYLPLLEALGRLGRGSEGGRFVQVLQQYAPSWLLHLPALVPPATFETLQRRAGGPTQERMLRELAEAVEVLTSAQPLVLVFEDLHWGDVSTLDWLAAVARRREAARLLVLGTYRPVEAIVREHPVHRITQDLRLRRQATEVVLATLSAAEVDTYVSRRFGALPQQDGLARILHQRTEGNPLFLVTVLDDLVQHGVMHQTATGWELLGEIEETVRGVPDSLQHLIERQLQQLAPADQRLLEAASVAGTDFVTATVAAGVDETVEAVELRCTALARQGQFLQVRGTVDWPDGTMLVCYRFLHALYRTILYDRIAIGQRIRWHRQLGAYLETAYGAQARTMAVELAEHFIRGRDTPRAVQYLAYAGEQALQRSAHQEAWHLLTQGLELLTTLPESPQRTQQELHMQIALGPVLMANKGAGAPEVEHTYARALALSRQVDAPAQQFPVLWGLWRFYHVQARHQQARQAGEEILALAQRLADPTLLLAAYQALGSTCYFLGEFVLARTYLEQGLACYNTHAEAATVFYVSIAPAVYCLAFAAQTLWALGYPDQALRYSQEASTLAEALAHPQSVAFAQYYAARMHMLRRELGPTIACTEAALALTAAQQFPYYHGLAFFLRGWALVREGQTQAGVAQMHSGFQEALATGAALIQPLFLTLFAEVAGAAGDLAEAHRLLTEVEGIVAVSAQHFYTAEVARLRGTFFLQQAKPDVLQATTAFQQALHLARQQQAKSWELRAAMALARLWDQQGKRVEAYHLLAEVYEWFTEGFDIADLQEAKALYQTLGGEVTSP